MHRQLKMGTGTVIILSSATAVKDLLDKRSATTVDRPYNHMASAITRGLNMIFAHYSMVSDGLLLSSQEGKVYTHRRLLEGPTEGCPYHSKPQSIGQTPPNSESRGDSTHVRLTRDPSGAPTSCASDSFVD